jgi:TetR/AcrR family transcriptional regulator, ethionamide resistance regulator
MRTSGRIRELDSAETAHVITWIVERCCYQMLRDAPREADRKLTDTLA